MFKFCVKLKRFAINFVYPSTKLEYFEIYLSTWIFINRNNDIASRRVIQIIGIVSMIGTFRHLFINEIDSNNLILRIIWCDFYSLMFRKPSINYMLSYNCLMGFVVCHFAYTNGDLNSLRLIYEILFKRKSDFFIYNTYNDKPIYDFVQQIIVSLLYFPYLEQ
ncbi:hypothetical protein BLOT_008710 [Blomia tropicalis]|nr:hypothetical protein BLOT_008710 [Blomia tropicalis]